MFQRGRRLADNNRVLQSHLNGQLVCVGVRSRLGARLATRAESLKRDIDSGVHTVFDVSRSHDDRYPAPLMFGKSSEGVWVSWIEAVVDAWHRDPASFAVSNNLSQLVARRH